MRIAILIYGRLSDFSINYEYMVHALSNYDSVNFFCSSDNSDESHLCEFIDKCKPIDYINDKINIDEYKYFYDFPNYSTTYIDSMIRHFINKNRVYNLVLKYIEATNKQYDIIMYLRADLKLYDKFNFEHPKDNNIYIPLGADWHGINDQIAYGNPDVMKIYANLIYNCKIIISTNLSYVHPESLTLANLIYNKLIINRYSLSYHIHKK
jgi:hypothetical protein